MHRMSRESQVMEFYILLCRKIRIVLNRIEYRTCILLNRRLKVKHIKYLYTYRILYIYIPIVYTNSMEQENGSELWEKYKNFVPKTLGGGPEHYTCISHCAK